MYKIRAIFILFIINSFLFANVANNNIQIEEKVELTFEEKSQEHITKILKLRKIPRLFISKKNLKRYYKTFDNNLIWINENGIKNISLNLIDAIKNDPVLKPHSKKAFKLEKIINELNNLDKSEEKYLESMTKIDFMLTGIYDRYMRYLSKGFINWKLFKKELKELDKKEEISADWEKYNARKDYKKLLLTAINENDLDLAFNEVNFTYPKAKELADAINDFEQISQQGGYTKLPKFKTLREGASTPVVKLLRQRLLESRDLKNDECINLVENEIDAQDIVTNTLEIKKESVNIKEVEKVKKTTKKDIQEACFNKFDEKVKEAVISFQKNHGLLADGIVGKNTRRYLNIPVESKIIQMRLNLERMRWLPRTLGEKFLLVNIPDFKLKMYDKDKIKLEMPIVVGKRKHPTPIFSNQMSFVVLNPYWRVPQSIVKNEIIPKLVKDPAYLEGRGIQIHENWDIESNTFDINSIDWNSHLEQIQKEKLLKRMKLLKEEIPEEMLVEEESEKLPTYRFIQLPSDKNPLGRIKFMFPNKYSVYLHDTPAKKYFRYTKRAYSHGCVRLSKPKALLEAIANDDDNVNYTEATDILKDIEKTQIGLNQKIPVHMVYITSWIDEEGNIQFRDDVYKYDRMQRKLLYKKNQFM